MHVLSLPPAFVLSQDQTLKLKRSLNRQDHYVLTRAPLRPQASLPKIMVALINVCPPKSLSGYLSIPRKDLVAYVSLSSYSHVKEQLPKTGQNRHPDSFSLREPYRPRWPEATLSRCRNPAAPPTRWQRRRPSMNGDLRAARRTVNTASAFF